MRAKRTSLPQHSRSESDGESSRSAHQSRLRREDHDGAAHLDRHGSGCRTVRLSGRGRQDHRWLVESLLTCLARRDSVNWPAEPPPSEAAFRRRVWRRGSASPPRSVQGQKRDSRDGARPSYGAEPREPRYGSSVQPYRPGAAVHERMRRPAAGTWPVRSRAGLKVRWRVRPVWASSRGTVPLEP